MTVCDLKSVDVTSDTFKVLRVHSLYSKEIQNEKNFCKVILNIENVLKL